MSAAVVPTVIPIPRVVAPPALADGSTPLPDAAVGVTDGGMGRAVVFGLTVGTLAIFLLTLGVGIAAGLGLGTAAGVAVLPAFFGGLYFGGAPALLVQLQRFEQQRRRGAAA